LETKTISEQFPWAKPGAEAYIYNRNGWGVTELRKVQITKVTKSRVTTTGDRVFYVRKHGNTLTVLGLEHYRSPDLIAADDPRVAEAKAEALKQKIDNAARAAADDFHKSRTVDNAHKAVAALLDFIKANQEEAK